MHETIHAFITKHSRWIHDLKEDATDFINEAAARIIIDDMIKRLLLHSKIETYYENNMQHKNELILYDYNLSEKEYSKLEQEWYKIYSGENNIDGFCKYLLEYYKNNKGKIGRKKNLSYKLH